MLLLVESLPSIDVVIYGRDDFFGNVVHPLQEYLGRLMKIHGAVRTIPWVSAKITHREKRPSPPQAK